MAARFEVPPILGDRFEIRTHLGSGGMGDVYRAHDRERGELVALKVLPRLDATALLRFKNEFRALHDIQHEHLVLLHELHEDRGTWFFTMQLVDGVDLLTWVGGHRRAEQDTVPDRAVELERTPSREVPPCDEGRLRAVLPQVARALQRLHDAGLVHRDVKPSNVLVTPAGHACVLDFGLVAPARSTGDGIGTPDYMAPEQIAGAIGPASDWYALGVLVFRALTGSMPFLGTAPDVLRDKVCRAAPAVRDLRATAPADLATLADALLASDPERRPTGAAVLEALGAARHAAAPARRMLIGRDRELALLRTALADRLRGDPLSMCVAGESGIGKTALLRAFTDEIAGDAWVLWGRCWERESVPFKGLDGVVDELAARLARSGRVMANARGQAGVLVQAFPVLRGVFALADVPAELVRETAARVAGAVRWLLAEIAAEQPLVVVIDDLQWADRDTVAVLRGVLDALPPNMLLVFGARTPLELPTVRTVALAPLSDDATTALVTRLVDLQGATAVDAAAIAREAGGHPLFAVELAQLAVSTGETRPVSIEDAVRRLVDRLGADARAIVETVSLAHAPIALEPLARATAVPGFHAALAALRASQLVATSGVGAGIRVEPYHDRLRKAFTAPPELSTDARREIHQRLALALAAWPDADAEALALHWSDAGHPTAAVGHAVRAAEQAEAALAFHRAARLYRWAAELATDRPALRIKHAEALAQAGLGVDAANAYLACAREAAGVGAVDLRRRAMQQLLLMGHTDRALELLDELMRELGVANPTEPRRLLLALVVRRGFVRLRRLELPTRIPDDIRPGDRARIDLTWDAAAGLALVDPVRSAYFQSLNLDLAFRFGDASRLTRALFGEAPYLASSGRSSRRLQRVLELADRAAARVGIPAIALLARGMSACLTGHWAEARAKLDELDRFFVVMRPRLVDDGFGVAQLVGMTRSLLLAALLYLGHIDELARRTPELLRDALDRNDVTAATYCRTGTQTVMWLARGDIAEATRNADAGLQPWRTRKSHLPHFMDLHARASIDLYAGRTDAHARVLSAWPELERSGLVRGQYIHITLLDIRGRSAVAAACGPAGREALADARWCAARLEREGAIWSVPLAHAIRAGVALVDRDPDGGRRWLARAAAGFAHADMALHLASVRLARACIDGDRTTADGQRAALARSGVAEPDRFSRLLLPRPA